MPTGKKDSTPKANSSSLSSLHPPYIQMISEAITTMKDRTGSSQPAIAKFIEENYTKLLPPNFKKILSIQLKRFVKSEKLVKVKNSYKVSAAEKTKKSSVSAQKKASTVPKKKTTNKSSTVVRNAEAKVTAAKKTKRLSQVKTPEGLKKMRTISANGEKMMKSKAATPAKRKTAPKSVKTASMPAAKRAKN
ncbi:Histone H1-I [Sesamum alatum]|uniref:Histone H1-I n=1 Tax=Sesamum alatum TaxID=300844 RepID=A0AAE1XU39_9LAMI|nr:Histone H1-I [Sesamum alatum]